MSDLLYLLLVVGSLAGMTVLWLRVVPSLMRALRGPTRTSWAWCPKCRRDLNGDAISFVSDEADSGGPVTYRCADCQTVSVWDFDAPAPLLLETAP
jgi:hypothetical protein